MQRGPDSDTPMCGWRRVCILNKHNKYGILHQLLKKKIPLGWSPQLWKTRAEMERGCGVSVMSYKEENCKTELLSIHAHKLLVLMCDVKCWEITAIKQRLSNGASLSGRPHPPYSAPPPAHPADPCWDFGASLIRVPWYIIS